MQTRHAARSLAVMLVAGLAQPALAQQPDDRGATIDLDFRGGTVSSYIEHLKQLTPSRLQVNVVLDPAAGEISLSPVVVRDLELTGCFELIPSLRLHQTDPEPIVDVFPNATGDRSTLVRVTANVDRALTETQLQVFPVARAVAGLAPDAAKSQLETAVSATLRMLENREPRRVSGQAEVSLHLESGTMVMVGTMEQLRAVHELISGMVSERMNMTEQAQEQKQREAERKYAIQLATIDLEQAKTQHAHATMELDRFGKLRAEGQASDSEVASLRHQMKMFEFDMARSAAKLDALRQGAWVRAGAHAEIGNPQNLLPTYRMATADNTPPDLQTLQSRIDELEAEVRQLRSQLQAERDKQVR